ncbi:MAG: UvrD-helicase domain-containing protein [Phycisphaerales bacterium]|nr:UvrD-helicase domain-containing protein [Phycisphaerales bacterium]
MTFSAPPPLPRADLVLASAGTGKTFQLAMHIIRLLARGTPPNSILAVTFTRKAAGEIAQRVLRSLAEGAAGGEPLKRLREFIDPHLTRARAAELAASFARSLHEFGAMTIDGFMARTARCAALDLDAPPAWRILDEPESEVLSRQAVAHAADHLDRSFLLLILDAFGAGHSGVNVEGTLFRAARDARRAYSQSREAPEAWGAVGPSRDPLDNAALAEAREALAAASLPLTKKGEPDKRFANARSTALRHVDQEQWALLLDGAFAPNAALNKESYSRVAYPPDLREALSRLAAHGAAVELQRLRARNRASFDFIRAHDAALWSLKRAHAAFDFDDVPRLLLASSLTPEQLAFQADRQFTHVLLDEFQDTSLDQFEVLQPLMSEAASGAENASLFCVGDAKQSLYTWRNAEPALLGTLESTFSMSRRDLARSFRSAQAVLDSVNDFARGLAGANALIGHRPVAERFLRDFRPHIAADSARLGVVRAHFHESDEPGPRIARVVTHISGLVRDRPGCTVGVLTRHKKDIPLLVRLLRAAGIEASQEGGGPLRDASIVRAVWTMLQVANFPEDTAALDHLLNSPLAAPLGLGQRAPRTADEGESVARLLRARLAREGLAPLLRELRRACWPLLSSFERGRLTQLVEAAQNRGDDSPRAVRHLQRFFESVPLDRPAAARVRVMSIHASKGLEFDIVVLPDLAQPLLHPGREVIVSREGPLQPVEAVTHSCQVLRPWCPALDLAHRRAEETRVFGELCVLYVALTRAIHQVDLFLVARAEKPDLKPTLDDLVVDAFNLPRTPAPGTVVTLAGDPHWTQAAPPAPGPAPVPPLHLEVRPARHVPAARLDRLAPSHAAHHELPWTPQPSGRGGALKRGELLHALLAGLTWFDSPPVEPPAASFERARATGASEDDIARAWRQLAPSLALRADTSPGLAPLFAPILGASLRIEHPIAARIRHEGKEVLITGRFDRLVLLPRRAGAWIIDYKSDQAANEDDIARIVLSYEPQLRLYARAAAKAYALSLHTIRITLALIGPARLIDLPGET